MCSNDCYAYIGIYKKVLRVSTIYTIVGFFWSIKFTIPMRSKMCCLVRYIFFKAKVTVIPRHLSDNLPLNSKWVPKSMSTKN